MTSPRIKKAIAENWTDRRPAKVGEVYSFVIPVPVSVNAMYRNVAGRGRALTQRYKDWRDEAGTELATQKPPAFYDGRVDISVILRIPTAPRADCSNFVKAAEDLLVHCGVIKDDSYQFVRQTTARWDEAERECRLMIYYAPLSTPEAA
jgi:Holliday junction resolvase RusA-like endonuclease